MTSYSNLASQWMGKYPTKAVVGVMDSPGPIKTITTELSTNATWKNVYPPNGQNLIMGSSRIVANSPATGLSINYNKPVDNIVFGGSAWKHDILFAIEDKIRASNRYVDKNGLDQWVDSNGHGLQRATDGIKIVTLEHGNDLIYPNGRGTSTFYAYAAKHELALVDIGDVYVNTNDGDDVVVGGYGRDLIGAKKSVTAMKDLYINKLASPETQAFGSKLYVGGSNSDVLDGSNDHDYLVGDRMNGFELILPAKALTKELPATFNVHKQNILRYQPESWTKERLYSGAGYGYYFSKGDPLRARTSESLTYPLWMPGNDVIHGYGGNDYLYGDDTTLDNLAILVQLKKDAVNAHLNHSYPNFNWLTHRFGDDVLDGGPGDDMIYGGFGSDAIIGGPGADFINCGDQIIANGYNPFFGPKVIWGDSYKANKTDTVTKYPDVFSIGNLYKNENDLKASTSGLIDSNQIAQDINSNLVGMREIWEKTLKIAEFIPKVGGIISKLGGLLLNLKKNENPKVPESGLGAQYLDAMTVIKDFDELDQIVLATSNEENLYVDDSKSDIDTMKAGDRVQFNPLLTTSPSSTNYIQGPGKLIQMKRLDNFYDRVFLQGYTDKLYKLHEEYDATNKVTYTHIGGSAWLQASIDAGYGQSL